VADKTIALINAILKGRGSSDLTGDIRYLTRYFCPDKDVKGFNHVKLRPLTLVGFMEMGKTETAKYLIDLSQRHFEEHGIGYISFTGKTIVDIMYYIRDNPDLVRDVNVIHIFVDDLFYGGLSTERSKGKRLGEKIYSDIRHWPERIGMKSGILYVLFSAQRFSLIPVFFRNTPFILFKGMSIQDKYEKTVIKEVLTSADENNSYTSKLADILIDILQAITHLAYVEYRDDVKALTVVKPLRKKPYIFVQPRLAEPDLTEVPFNYSGVFEEQDYNVKSTDDVRVEFTKVQRILKYIANRLNVLKENKYLVRQGSYIWIRTNGKEVPFLKVDVAEKLGIWKTKHRK